MTKKKTMTKKKKTPIKSPIDEIQEGWRTEGPPMVTIPQWLFDRLQKMENHIPRTMGEFFEDPDSVLNMSLSDLKDLRRAFLNRVAMVQSQIDQLAK